MNFISCSCQTAKGQCGGFNQEFQYHLWHYHGVLVNFEFMLSLEKQQLKASFMSQNFPSTMSNPKQTETYLNSNEDAEDILKELSGLSQTTAVAHSEFYLDSILSVLEPTGNTPHLPNNHRNV